MDLIMLFGALLAAAVMFGMAGVLATSPGWTVGLLAGLAEVSVPVHPLVNTRSRRALLWAVSCIGMAASAQIALRETSLTAVLFLTLFGAAGQHFAFYMAYTRAAAWKARRRTRDAAEAYAIAYQQPPANIIRADENQGFVPAAPAGDDEYQPARPSSDQR